MNRIENLFLKEKKEILSLFFMAGYPQLQDTEVILETLQEEAIDIVEIGIPFSDPLADGEVIQSAGQQALKNGMNLKLLFQQLKDFQPKRKNMAWVMMGYLNPILQFGMEDFCKSCKDGGVDGVIIPDLPLEEYVDHYQHLFEKYDLCFIPMITPQTSEMRIRNIDKVAKGFIYVVSSASTTGSVLKNKQENYFERIKSMGLKNPLMVGFGISDRSSFRIACQYSNGAIIGSAFIRAIHQSDDLKKDIHTFIKTIR